MSSFCSSHDCVQLLPMVSAAVMKKTAKRDRRSVNKTPIWCNHGGGDGNDYDDDDDDKGNDEYHDHILIIM